ncbi:MAG TPA: TRAP transporter large permease subunit [Ramlibacter sp.]|nr:TRAP transporter large permease subunit [Ramlibacter sp.]
MIIAFGLFCIAAFLLVAVPIGFALGLAGIASLSTLIPAQSILALMTKVFHENTANSLILTIPMFVLMAEFLGAGGVAEDLLLACNRVMRRIRGGMAMACILAGTVHAAATGSSSASAASLARASFPAMMKAGYKPALAVGAISIAGTLAIMIPPSVAFVLFGLMTETSVGKLFLAGIIPGLITALGYIITISVILWFKPELGPEPGREAVVPIDHEKGAVWPMVVLIAVILGGLYAGVATPTEISAIGAIGALVISMATGRMTRASFIEAIAATLRISTMIIVIIVGAHFLGYFMSFSKITDAMLAWTAQSGLSPTAVMLLVVFIYLLLGMVLDQGAIIILTAPISTALMVKLGYDPIWWGVVIIKTAEIGLVHPPIGVVLFVTSAATKTDLKTCFMGVLPFLVTELLLLALLVAYPQLSLWILK